MVPNHYPSIKGLTNKILAYAKKQLTEDTLSLVGKFMRLYYNQICIEDFEGRPITDIYGAVYSHWELMHHRNPDEVKIAIFNPHYEQHGWQSTHTIIEVVIDDMPFLVDSLRMELDRLGLTTHLMIYMGGMKIVRNEQGYIEGVLPRNAKNKQVHIESPIYMEIDRQTDPKMLERIRSNLTRVIADVQLAVRDWRPMQERLKEFVDYLKKTAIPLNTQEINETIAYLEWLLNNHFTFLGSRDYEIVEKDNQQVLRLVAGSSLGVLADESHSKIIRYFSEMPEKAREIVLSTEQILIISKTNSPSTVHRPTNADDIWVKKFNEKGEFIGMRRFIGHYTSEAYSKYPNDIPKVREKVLKVLELSKLAERSHAYKDLMHILAALPRDDLFQADVNDLLRIASGILHLQDRRRVRLFVREDAYGRYISCLVYIPRENFNTEVLNKIQTILKKAFNGTETSFTTDFPGPILARIHYVIRIESKQIAKYNLEEIEKKLIAVGKSWQDGFREEVLDYFGEERGNELINRYRKAFPAGYREIFTPRHAVYDIENMEKLSPENPLTMVFYRPLGAKPNEIRFKLFTLGDTVPLSDALPMLENMGLRVLGEEPHEILLEQEGEVWINDFSMTYAKEEPIDVEKNRYIFQESFKKIWQGLAENDSINRLVLEAQLTWREISVLRAYSKYLLQTRFTFSQQYIAEALVNNPSVAKLLMALFMCRFEPKVSGQSDAPTSQLESMIYEQLDEVASLDEDRILRRLLELIHATLRTNYFQVNGEGEFKPYIAFKLNSNKISDLPLPRPKYEIFVYSPRFEGIHLRAAKVARGGIRLSTRREDFRDEVLSLMKTQQVKNALIVPAGAKGGFVAKNLSADASREIIQEECVACYRDFINGLLDLTDNLKASEVISPADTICYDDADTYLVVAADKGTATYSDIANQIAAEHNFWLGDAFASGGSTGYDHKKMGITARGAWVSVERQFQEFGINADETEISVVGVGDMSGDVFGNGMLLSNQLKLLAAFNHQHIFIDPNPDIETSFKERLRLFKLQRSTWDNYNRELLSKGGGIYRRTVKSISVSPEVKKAFNINKDVLAPNEMIKAILRAEVDLMWNGGVGTFVKASNESHSDAGDRTNDNIRINGNELNARVVCEGGNLGLTQLGRIEYELKGGRINTDFIDNSAGVDCSDHEVNSKILLNAVVAQGDMTEKQRNQLLADMTNEVADLVLQNNYHQNQAISLAAYLSSSKMGLYMRYIDTQEQNGKINRMLEYLPDNKTLLERKSAGLGLTRPELCILFAYSKIILEEQIRKSKLTDDPFLAQFAKNAFPTPLRKRYGRYLKKHRLRKEIISTQLSNQLVSDMGITYTYQMFDETGAPITAIVRAYAATRIIFHMSEMFADIESLDYKVDTAVQHSMTDDVIRLVRRSTRWLLRNRRSYIDIEKTISHFSGSVINLFRRLPKLLVGESKSRFERRRDELIEMNVPVDIAIRVASTSPMYHALNIIEAATVYGMDIDQVAKIYFILIDRLNLLWFRDQINFYPAEDRWSMLAKAAYMGDLDWIHRELTMGVLKLDVVVKSISSRIKFWFDQYHPLIQRWESILSDIRGSEVMEFAIFSVAIRELSDLAATSKQTDFFNNRVREQE